jgi:hypothetical protein
VTEKQTSTYKLALKNARADFDIASKRLREVSDEAYCLKEDIGKLRRTITALAALCTEEPGLDDMGITESCMEVMETQHGLVTTARVVEMLELRGFDITSQKNAAASVHRVLSRLATKKKIERVDDQEEQVVKWKGPNYDPDIITDDDIPF